MGDSGFGRAAAIGCTTEDADVVPVCLNEAKRLIEQAGRRCEACRVRRCAMTCGGRVYYLVLERRCRAARPAAHASAPATASSAALIVNVAR